MGFKPREVATTCLAARLHHGSSDPMVELGSKKPSFSKTARNVAYCQ